MVKQQLKQNRRFKMLLQVAGFRQTPRNKLKPSAINAVAYLCLRIQAGLSDI